MLNTFIEFMGLEYVFIFTIAACVVDVIGLLIAIFKIKSPEHKIIKMILIIVISFIGVICCISAAGYIYIQYKPSEWVLITEVPDGAKIIDRKWVYNWTDEKEYENSDESNCVLIYSDWIASDPGTHLYAEFPTNLDGYEYYNISDQYYQKYNFDAYTSYETPTKKREITDEQITSYIYYHWVYPLNELGEANREIGEFKGKMISDGGAANCWESFENGYIEYDLEAEAYQSKGHSQYSYWWNGRIPVYTQTYIDSKMVYIYTIESSTEVKAGEHISDVQEYVRYRLK